MSYLRKNDTVNAVEPKEGERKMLRILDKLLLFAMCSCLIFQLEGDYRRVVIFIIGLIVAALTLYIENRKVIGALLIAMAVLCLIEPGFTFLLPLVFFDSFWFGLWWGMGFAVLFFYALPVYQPWMTASGSFCHWQQCCWLIAPDRQRS